MQHTVKFHKLLLGAFMQCNVVMLDGPACRLRANLRMCMSALQPALKRELSSTSAFALQRLQKLL